MQIYYKYDESLNHFTRPLIFLLFLAPFDALLRQDAEQKTTDLCIVVKNTRHTQKKKLDKMFSKIEKYFLLKKEKFS